MIPGLKLLRYLTNSKVWMNCPHKLHYIYKLYDIYKYIEKQEII